jgi:endonuclease/exonuclease/phosphatase family metal-dependent hydrolase
MLRPWLRSISLRALFWMNLFSALLLLLCYSAPYVSPSTTSLLAILALGYPFFLLLNLIWMGFWIYQKSRLAYLSFFSILVGLSFIPQVIGFGRSSAAEEGIRLMSYNVRYFNTSEYADADRQLKEQDKFLAYIKAKRPTILFGQEFSGKGKASSKRADAFLKDSLGLIYQHRGGGSSLAIMSKYPLENVGTINFEGSFNGAIYADVLVGERIFRLYSVHLQSTRLGSDAREVLKKENITSLNTKETQQKYYRISSKLKTAFELRAAQARIIAQHAAEAPYPAIICGDFNDTPMSYAYRILAKGRKDSFVEKGWGIGATYAGGLPALRIDYILLHSKFKVFNHQLQERAISDHRAIVSDVSYVD